MFTATDNLNALRDSARYHDRNMIHHFDDAIYPGWNFNKMEEVFRVSEEIIHMMTPDAVEELFSSADDAGLGNVFDSIMEETYAVLYGTRNEKPKTITSESFGYLDKLTNSVDETLRCENLTYFITSVMPEFEMNWHHYEWCDLAMRFRRLVIEAARDHGKSYWCSNAVPAWIMYKYKGRSGKTAFERNPRTFLFSFSIQQAIDLLDILKSNIEENDILRERLYTKENWNKTDIVCKNKARLTVKGFGSSVRGAHPGHIICDDILKDNVLFSKTQREKGINYFHSVIMNMLVPGGWIGVVGTPFHSLDIFGDLKTKKGWKVFEYPAIFPDGRLLWDGRWDFPGLMEKRETQGNLIFSRELLCRPITSDSTIFPIEILNNALFRMENYTLTTNRDSYKIKFDRVISGCDFAISANVGADYTVFLTFGLDDKDRMWLMHAWRKRGASFAEQMAMLKFINMNFRPNLMMLEKNQFQQIFVEEADRQNLPVVGESTGTEKNDLKRGWPGMAIGFERGKYKMPTGDQFSKDFSDMAVLEFSSVAFTDEHGLQSTSGHDDICSAWWQGEKAANKLSVEGFKFDFI